MRRWIRNSGRTPSFAQGPRQSPQVSQAFYEKLQPQQVFLPTAAPATIPAPGPSDSVKNEVKNPTHCYIVDFHYDRLHDKPEEGLVSHGFDRKDMIESDKTPDGLMTPVYKPLDLKPRPDLRWIHIPWNSMLDTEVLMRKICQDIGLKEEAVASSILPNDKWDDLFHVMESNTKGINATYMQTTCQEISISKKHIKCLSLKLEAERGESRFNHRGANMVLFMPFLHWGREDVLTWRNAKTAAFKAHIDNCKHEQPPSENCLRQMLNSEGSEEKTEESEGKRFYAKMMATQLYNSKPLHARRTLDQWYYSTTCDTSKLRDFDQIVAKFGPEDHKKKRSPILIVDQLWLWILGGSTVVTCFDRRWEQDESESFQCNVFDKILSWTLKQEARHVKCPYELAHLIINEVSGIFFNYSITLKPAIRFHEIFKLAISQLNNRQTIAFRRLSRLYVSGPIWELPPRRQDKIFTMRKELKLVKEVRDLVDELSMIARVYEDQASIIDPLADNQFADALFREGVTDEEGHAKIKNNGGQQATQNDSEAAEDSSSSHVPIIWDQGGWFMRTRRLIFKYQNMVDRMIEEATQIADSLQNTINLKQNSGSLFEAHASRKEAEAIMVFTLVSSCILPLSFGTSVFGMNVAELSGENPVSLGVAMLYIVPISLLIFGGFWGFAFQRDVIEKVASWIHDKKKKRNKARKAKGVREGEPGRGHDSDDDSTSSSDEDGGNENEAQSSALAAKRSSVRRRWFCAHGDDGGDDDAERAAAGYK
ncbi:hypothetical protein B0H63DRAFT_488660 [Podospora didyma]|uniref:Uncharacterized protein n=1 Tax=Podospora didyma TaxID=330526 RepID=A0AAE0K324_9PEZI|nr:hypothetical protein B0H63DRAFT_488660 [Podospora didyma]